MGHDVRVNVSSKLEAASWAEVNDKSIAVNVLCSLDGVPLYFWVDL